MENSLPKGWAETCLSDIAEINYGKDFRKTDLSEQDGYPVYSANGIIGFSKTYNRENETVALGCRGSVGTIHLTKPKCFITHNCFSIEPIAFFEKRFIKYLLTAADLSGVITGTAQPQITITNLSPLRVVIPPLLEQERIVAKLDELMEKIDRSRALLERIPKILKRFRQSILSAAVSGKLTEEWRGKNSKIESGEDLILRIKELRSKRYDEACKKALKEGKRKPSNFDNYNVNLRSDFDLFEIPDNWRWVDFRFVMSEEEAFCYGVVQPGDEANDGNFLIRAGDLKNNTVDTTSLRTISKIVDAEYSRSRVSGGELLITVVGAGIGECGIVPKSCKGYNIARAVAKIPIKDFNSKYILLWLNSSAANKWMKAEAREVARPTLNLEQLRTIPLPLPPSEEQNEIVRRVEQLFALADKIEGRYTKAKAQVDKLPQSLLVKAFRGELVAQDVNDEPASVLLERIKNEKVINSKKSKYKKIEVTA